MYTDKLKTLANYLLDSGFKKEHAKVIRLAGSRGSMGAVLPWKYHWAGWQWKPAEWWGGKYVIVNPESERASGYSRDIPLNKYRLAYEWKEGWDSDYEYDRDTVDYDSSKIMGDYNSFEEAAQAAIKDATSEYLVLFRDRQGPHYDEAIKWFRNEKLDQPFSIYVSEATGTENPLLPEDIQMEQ